jgi:tRNA modification GTPase
MAVVMWQPNSYTCDDTVEFSTHGSSYVSSQVVELLVRSGARHAGPGEFTLRAYLNGRIDLSQAEAVADLIAAKTELSHRTALAQLSGNLSVVVTRLRKDLVTSLAMLEAYTDFPDEEIDESHLRLASETIASAMQSCGRLVKSFSSGRVLKEGIVVPIVGAPNSGKSSLFNYLLDHDRAIVTPTAGTTRDTISECISVNGLAVELIDTAGIRESPDAIELAGIERSRREIERANIVVALVDSTSQTLITDIAILTESMAHKIHVLAANKIDLLDERQLDSIRKTLGEKVVPISALTGSGIDDLKDVIFRRALPDDEASEKDQVKVSTVRHKVALESAIEQLKSARDALNDKRGPEIVAFEFRLAIDSLSQITGEISADDVLDEIFSRFCIGK